MPPRSGRAGGGVQQARGVKANQGAQLLAGAPHQGAPPARSGFPVLPEPGLSRSLYQFIAFLDPVCFLVNCFLPQII